MSKTWGSIGAWAAEAEREEAEERELRSSAAAANSPVTGAGDSQSFPSLREATAAKPKKKKAMTLSEFTMGTNVGRGGAAAVKGLMPDEMLMLPTGPKERSPEEIEQGRFGRGGFQSYGRIGASNVRNQERDGSWSGGGGGGRRSYGGFDEERRGPPPRVSDFDQPSRADEVDNWAIGKKSVPVMDSGRNDNRYSSLGGGSRADEVDNWAIGKKSIPVGSSGSFRSGFGNSTQDSDGDRARPRLVLDPPRGDGGPPSEPAKTTRPSPFGAARPREDVLAEKGLDWRMQESEIEGRKYAGSQSSRPSSSQSSRSDSSTPQVVVVGGPVMRPKVNPFGDAKPREVMLQEQGKDWRKMDCDMEHRAVDRPETEEEKKLKEEIQHIKEEIEKEANVNANGSSLDGAGGPQPSLHELLLSREKDLELLIRNLDDKVRFGERVTDRPGSGVGQTIGFLERPSSRSSTTEEPRNRDIMDRPRSHGSDVWTRPSDDRRTQGVQERGFFGNREMDRSKSKERW